MIFAVDLFFFYLKKHWVIFIFLRTLLREDILIFLFFDTVEIMDLY